MELLALSTKYEMDKIPGLQSFFGAEGWAIVTKDVVLNAMIWAVSRTQLIFVLITCNFLQDAGRFSIAQLYILI